MRSATHFYPGGLSTVPSTSTPISFEPDHESPNDIFCPQCMKYKDYCLKIKPKLQIYLLVCPDCNTEVRIN